MWIILLKLLVISNTINHGILLGSLSGLSWGNFMTIMENMALVETHRVLSCPPFLTYQANEKGT